MLRVSKHGVPSEAAHNKDYGILTGVCKGSAPSRNSYMGITRVQKLLHKDRKVSGRVRWNGEFSRPKLRTPNKSGPFSTSMVGFRLRV